jgi:hypothetical protein
MAMYPVDFMHESNEVEWETFEGRLVTRRGLSLLDLFPLPGPSQSASLSPTLLSVFASRGSPVRSRPRPPTFCY